MTTELLSEAEWLQSIADLDSVALLMGMPAEAVDRYEEILNARGYTGGEMRRRVPRVARGRGISCA
jgi:hypothetical protein